MRAQLENLVDLSGLPNVTLQVLPFSAGVHPAMDGGFSIRGFPDPAADPAGCSARGGREQEKRAVLLFVASVVLATLADLLADGQAPPWLVRVGARLALHFPAGSRELRRDRRGLLVQGSGRPLFPLHYLAGDRGLCRDRPGLFLQELGRPLVALLPGTAAKETYCAAKETHGVIIGRRPADFPIRASRVADELADHAAFVLPLLCCSLISLTLNSTHM
jgi:hypothetical protein